MHGGEGPERDPVREREGRAQGHHHLRGLPDAAGRDGDPGPEGGLHQARGALFFVSWLDLQAFSWIVTTMAIKAFAFFLSFGAQVLVCSVGRLREKYLKGSCLLRELFQAACTLQTVIARTEAKCPK